MIAGKGVLLIIIGSLVVLLGAVAEVLLSWNEGVHSFVFVSLCSDSACANVERMAQLSALSNHLSALFSLIDGSLVPLALAALGPALASLLRGKYALTWGWYRWLAMVGLACLSLIAFKAMVQVLIAKEQIRLGLTPGLDTWMLTHWLLRPPLWSSLFGFLMVLWGSFLKHPPVDAQDPPQL